MKHEQLDPEEQDILEAFESGEFESQLMPERLKFLQQSAAHTLQKSQQINIEILDRDLAALQRKALKEGMSYQTLVSSILHKYVSGSLYDANPQKKQSIQDLKDFFLYF